MNTRASVRGILPNGYGRERTEGSHRPGLAAVMMMVLGYCVALLAVSSANAEKAKSNHQEWRFKDVKSIDIDCIVAKVDVFSWDSNEVKVTMDADYSTGEKRTSEVGANDGKLTIREESPARRIMEGPATLNRDDVSIAIDSGHSVYDPDNDSLRKMKKIGLTVAVPRGVILERMRLSVLKGDLTCQEVTSTGPVEVKVASGNVVISRSAVGTAVVTVANGKISARDVESDSIEVTASNGSISIDGAVTGSLSASASAGSINAKSCDVAKIARFATAYGKIRARLISVPTARLSVTDVSGKARITMPAPTDVNIITHRNYEENGKFDLPIKCSDCRVDNRYRTFNVAMETCTAQQGEHGLEIDLTTGDGHITLEFTKP